MHQISRFKTPKFQSDCGFVQAVAWRIPRLNLGKLQKTAMCGDDATERTGAAPQMIR
jgi:hypothetical protein